MNRPASLREQLTRLDSSVSELSPDGKHLAIAEAGNRVVLVELPSGKVGLELDCERCKPRSIAWRPDGAEIAVLDHHGFVRVFGLHRPKPRLRFATSSTSDSSDFEPRVVAWARGGAVIATALGTPAELFDARDGNRLARIAIADGVRISELAVSTDGELVALGDESGAVAIWDAATGRRTLGPIRVPRGKGWPGVQALAFHPDRSALAIGGGDCNVRIWKLDGSGAPRELPHCDSTMFDVDTIRHLAFSPDGRMLAATTGDGWATRVWSTTSWKVLWTHGDGCGNPIRMRADFTLDSRYLLTGFDAVVTRTSDWSAAHRFEPVTDLGIRLAYRAAGQFVWMSADERFLVWSAETGKVVLDHRPR